MSWIYSDRSGPSRSIVWITVFTIHFYMNLFNNGIRQTITIITACIFMIKTIITPWKLDTRWYHKVKRAYFQQRVRPAINIIVRDQRRILPTVRACRFPNRGLWKKSNKSVPRWNTLFRKRLKTNPCSHEQPHQIRAFMIGSLVNVIAAPSRNKELIENPKVIKVRMWCINLIPNIHKGYWWHKGSKAKNLLKITQRGSNRLKNLG